MKTTSVLSSLAIALPAFAAPAIRATTGSCPDINRAEITSGNQITYTISCGNDVSTTILRTTDTEVGLQGCLAACDGTVGCNAVTFTPSSDDAQKGTCASRTQGAQHSANDEKVALAIRLTPEATSTMAWPTATGAPYKARRAAAATPSAFGAVAIHSGSDIQYQSVNANGTHFWLNKDSAVYTPNGVTNSGQRDTLFVGGSSTLSLDTQVPGGQQVYVDSTGALRFTVPHSADTGSGSKTTGFTLSSSSLQFENNDFLACPTDGAYEIYAASVKTDSSCTGFSFHISESAGPAAFEYS